ncbi:unnamed protein product [Lota lota]
MMAPRDGYRVNKLTREPQLKAMLNQHTLDCQTNVQERISTLRARLATRGADLQTVEPMGVLETLQGFGRDLVSRLETWDGLRHRDS